MFTPTGFKDLWVFEPRVFEDERGYFFESFNLKNFKASTGLVVNFVQDNQSKSDYGVLRGLHFQKGDFAQAKLVRVLSGAVLDVVVDIRKNSPTFGQYFSIELSAANRKQLFVPHGFAHGFVVLSESAEFFYKCDNYYSPQHEGGIFYDSKVLQIDWKIPVEKLTISQKDAILPNWNMFLAEGTPFN